MEIYQAVMKIGARSEFRPECELEQSEYTLYVYLY